MPPCKSIRARPGNSPATRAAIFPTGQRLTRGGDDRQPDRSCDMATMPNAPGDREPPDMTACPADARLAIFDHRRGWQIGLLGALAVVLLSAIFVIAAVVEIAGTDLTSVSVDFYVFWAAARLALQGLALDAFDVARLQEVSGVVDDEWMPWAYPPGFLMLLMPFALLPFAPAWGAFNLAGAGALLWALKAFSAGRVQVLLAAGLAPAMLPCLLVGQTTLLWAAGLVAALAALRADRPVLAGICIGLLTLKPQLGLLIPVALLACGAWRAMIAAALTALVLAAIPTALFGAAYWPQMLATMGRHGDIVRTTIAGLKLMISAYSALASLGVPEPLALALQWALAGLAAVAVFVVWRRPAAGFDRRAAMLLTAIPLASPYLWHYESALMAPAALFMLRAGVIGARPAAGLILGLAMWIGLAPSTLAMLQTGSADVFRLVFVPIALAAFAACLRHATRQPAAAAPAPQSPTP